MKIYICILDILLMWHNLLSIELGPSWTNIAWLIASLPNYELSRAVKTESNNPLSMSQSTLNYVYFTLG